MLKIKSTAYEFKPFKMLNDKNEVVAEITQKKRKFVIFADYITNEYHETSNQDFREAIDIISKREDEALDGYERFLQLKETLKKRKKLTKRDKINRK